MASKAQIIDFLLAGYRDKATDEPLNAGTITVTVGGTSNTAYVWDDRDKTLPTTTGRSTITLDQYGKAEVYGDGIYKFVIKDSSGSTEETIDYAEYLSRTKTDAVDMLALIDISSPTDGEIADMLGYFTIFPQSSFSGGGDFVWQENQNKNTANGGTIVDPDNIGGFDGTVSTRDAFLTAQGGGTGSGCWVRQHTEIVWAEWFGVKGDDTQDDQAAIQAGNDHCRSVGAMLKVEPTTAGHKLSSKLHITADFDATGCTFNMPGTLPIAFEVSNGTGSNAVLSLKKISLPILTNSTKPGTGWAAQGTGYLLRNLDASEVLVQGAVDFGIGMHCAGESAGFSYNKITLGRVVNNEVNIRLQPLDSPGWVNQNQFIAGRCGYFEANGVASIQLLPSGFGSGVLYNAPNGNHFLTTSIEGGAPTNHLVIGGQFNHFENVRFEEDVGNPKIQFVGDTVVDGLCKDNVIYGGFHTGGAVFTNAGGSIACLNRQSLDHFGALNALSLSQGVHSNNTAGGTAVHYAGFIAGKDILNATDADADWVWRITEDFIQKKNTADANERVRIGAEGIRVGDGTTVITSAPLLVNVFGSPEGGTVAPPGSVAFNRNGGANIGVYGKDTGTGNTGWRAL